MSKQESNSNCNGISNLLALHQEDHHELCHFSELTANQIFASSSHLQTLQSMTQSNLAFCLLDSLAYIHHSKTNALSHLAYVPNNEPNSKNHS